MKNKTFAIILMSLAILSLSQVVKAEVPEVPQAVCVDVPGIPCPKDHKTNIAPRKTEQTNDLQEFGIMISKTVNQLLRLSEDYLLSVVSWIEDGYYEFKIFFDKLF